MQTDAAARAVHDNVEEPLAHEVGAGQGGAVGELDTGLGLEGLGQVPSWARGAMLAEEEDVVLWLQATRFSDGCDGCVCKRKVAIGYLE